MVSKPRKVTRYLDDVGGEHETWASARSENRRIRDYDKLVALGRANSDNGKLTTVDIGEWLGSLESELRAIYLPSKTTK